MITVIYIYIYILLNLYLTWRSLIEIKNLFYKRVLANTGLSCKLYCECEKYDYMLSLTLTLYYCVAQSLCSYLRRLDSLPLVPTEELRLTTRRSTSFLSSTPLEGPFSGMAFTPGPQRPRQETRRNTLSPTNNIY